MSRVEWNCFCTIANCGREFTELDPLMAATRLYSHQVNDHAGDSAIQTIEELRRGVKVVPTKNGETET